MIVAFDWDATLVDEEGEWLPGALAMFRWLRKHRHRAIILSSRASYPKGRAEIEGKLRQHRIEAMVYAKPYADVYVDDKGMRFHGDWYVAMTEMRRAIAREIRRRGAA